MRDESRERAPVDGLGAGGLDPRAVAIAADLALRGALIALLLRVRRAGPDDHRYRAKGIVSRASLLVPIVSVAMPAAWLRRGRGRYPFGMDSLMLSIVALDLAGNVGDLYDRYLHFDLLPHAHGTGALTILAAWALDTSILRGCAIATAGHALLEAQEAASDALFGYRNVRGAWDTIGDLAAGAIGTAIYGTAWALLRREAGRAVAGSATHEEAANE
jgi:hypothetical protein